MALTGKCVLVQEPPLSKWIFWTDHGCHHVFIRDVDLHLGVGGPGYKGGLLQGVL